MSDKPVWDEETWRWNDLYPSDVWVWDEGGYLLFEGADKGDKANARARLAACAPEAIRLLLESELGGTEHGNTACCPWCRGGEPYKGKKYEQASHTPDCRWLALMKKAGVR